MSIPRRAIELGSRIWECVGGKQVLRVGGANKRGIWGYVIVLLRSAGVVFRG